jgi:hypothetical protein
VLTEPILSSPHLRDDSFDVADPFCDALIEPQTPTTKKTRTHWHGLPSPLTPAIDQSCLEVDSANKESHPETSSAKGTDLLKFEDQPSVAFDKHHTLDDSLKATEALQSLTEDPKLTDSAQLQSPESDIGTPSRSSLYTCSGRQASPEPNALRRSTRLAKKPSKKGACFTRN